MATPAAERLLSEVLVLVTDPIIKEEIRDSIARLQNRSAKAKKD